MLENSAGYAIFGLEPQQAVQPLAIDLDTDYDYAMDLGEDFWDESGTDEDKR